MPPVAGSLFAADYSVSVSPTPSSRSVDANSPRAYTPQPSTGSPTTTRVKPLEIVFPPSPGLVAIPPLPEPPRSPLGSHESFTPAPAPVMAIRKKSSVSTFMNREVPQSRGGSLRTERPLSGMSSGVGGYMTYDKCMEGALGHELKSSSYAVGTDKAYHHLNRAADLFAKSLAFKSNSTKAMLGRGKVLIALAMTYQPPRTAVTYLKEATNLLRDVITQTPKSISAREALAQACGLLSSTLLETDDTADDEKLIWTGDVGKLAREALMQLEEVAGDRMDSMRAMNQQDSAQQSPSMAETFLALSAAAITVSSIAVDLHTVEVHIELAEQALDQASNMATVAAAARIKSSTSSANLITRVQLASNRSSLERLRHTFTLGVDLDEDDFRSLMADMTMLATECRERAAKLKGSKAAAASTLAYEAVKQLGDAKVLYASLLRLVWRKRRPAAGSRKGSNSSITASTSSDDRKGSRKLSSRMGSVEETIKEEEEDESTLATSPLAINSSLSSSPNSRGNNPPTSRQGSSVLGNIPDEEEISFTNGPRRQSRLSISVPATGRRGSWLPTPELGGPGGYGRNRRMSSMSAPLTGPDGISAWNRKASVICLQSDEPKGTVSSSQLAESAWQLLESAIKQFKLALSVLTTSDLPTVQLARSKTDVLTAIASASLFMASLAQRVAIAMEKRTSLLVTAEVYSTWAAREVGWSFLIEGTKEAQLADRRTNSWRADEAGKRAVMLLVRVWWHRAVTSETIDVDTKIGAKDAVERVVRRMKDKEGVKDGDVVRFKYYLSRSEGEMDPSEVLFWRSVTRILRGGSGFVMS